MSDQRRKAIALTAYAIVAWLVAILGALQIASAPRFFHGLSSNALWFVSGGIALLLTAALNLLNRSYGHGATGLRWCARLANIVMAAFLATDGIVDHAEPGPFVGVMLLMASIVALSFAPSALEQRTPLRPTSG